MKSNMSYRNFLDNQFVDFGSIPGPVLLIDHHHHYLSVGLNQKWFVPVPSRWTRAGRSHTSLDVPYLSIPSVIQ